MGQSRPLDFDTSRSDPADPAAAADARLAEELGQRLTAIGLALNVLRREGANPKAVRTIEVALAEARRELKLMRRGRLADHGLGAG